MKILNDGLAANSSDLIVAAIGGNSPQDIAAEILELNASKSSAESALSAANTELDTANTNLAAANTELATTKKDLAAANTELATTKKDLADALALNDTHEKTIEDLGKAAPVVAVVAADKNPTFELGGDTYGFNFLKLNHKGVIITPTEVCADTALQAELVKMQSGMIYKK